MYFFKFTWMLDLEGRKEKQLFGPYFTSTNICLEDGQVSAWEYALTYSIFILRTI